MEVGMTLIVALLSGILFGVGLHLSGMTDPQKVLGFLDLAGAWQPTLAFVMGGALLVTLPAFALIRIRSKPLLETKFHFPISKELDRPLLLGAAYFGIGWGIAGYCPGPAIASLATGAPSIAAFCVAMIGGMWIADRFATKSG